MRKLHLSVLAFILAVSVSSSCRKDRILSGDDSDLFREVNTGNGYVYYQQGNVLSGASPSPHGSFRLRFNSIAASALDSTGELPAGHTFPEGAVLVKELISGQQITQYAVMKKESSSENAALDWLWAEYSPDGKIDYSTAKKGDVCTGCHSGGVHRDHVRTFDLH